MGCFESKNAAPPGDWQHHGHTYYATYAQPAPANAVQHVEVSQYGGSTNMAAVSQDFLFAPFLKTQCPAGMTWWQFVQAGPCYVDPRGFLAGPWGQCIQAAVQFEHHNQWNLLPEYAGGEGPAGGVLASLNHWLRNTSSNHSQLMEAASRLEEAAHDAEDNGFPLPIQSDFSHSLNGVQAPAPSPYIRDAMLPPPTGFTQTASPMPFMGASGYGPCYHTAGSDYHQADPNFQQGYQPGPTLLQQHEQNQGMSTGAKVAVGVAAAGVGVAAGALLASHMHEAGDSSGDEGEFAGEHFEEAGDFLEDVF